VTDTPDRSLGARLFGWARRPGSSHDDGRGGPPVATKVLARLLAALAHREAPVVADLGPVVGTNVSFLGEQLGCRLRVEDLYADIDRLTREQVVLARQVVEWLKPGGVVLCVFSTVAVPTPVYTRYVIVDADHLVHRTSPAAHGRRTVYQSRDIERLFAGLGVSESFLLLNKTRQVLLRKQAAAPPRA
jgi:hypothetical protein